MSEAPEPLLVVDGLASGYGDLQVLWNVSLNVEAGSISVLLGRNGAGKTTTLRTIAGLNRVTAGSITMRGEKLTQLAPHARTRRGIGLVQEGKRIFRRRTVHENLLLGGYVLGLSRKKLSARCDQNYDRFPMLRGRAATTAGTLSGGQQQMLAIAQALMADPAVLMLDEPSAGLAPSVVTDVFDTISALRAEGLGVLLVEQAVEDALRVADRFAVLDVGRIVVSGNAARGRGRVCDPGGLSGTIVLMDQADPLVAVSISDGIAMVQVDDPAHRNAISYELSKQLAAAVGAIRADERVGALILTATPPVFSAGGSIDDLESPPGPLASRLRRLRGPRRLCLSHHRHRRRTGDRRRSQPGPGLRRDPRLPRRGVRLPVPGHRNPPRGRPSLAAAPAGRPSGRRRPGAARRHPDRQGGRSPWAGVALRRGRRTAPTGPAAGPPGRTEAGACGPADQGDPRPVGRGRRLQPMPPTSSAPLRNGRCNSRSSSTVSAACATGSGERKSRRPIRGEGGGQRSPSAGSAARRMGWSRRLIWTSNCKAQPGQ